MVVMTANDSNITIDGFSDKYFVKVDSQTNTVTVYDSKTQVHVIDVEYDTSWDIKTHMDVVDATKPINYKNQFIFSYLDLNFDGDKDFAFMPSSGVGGRTFYEIYLYNDGRFNYSENFSDALSDSSYYTLDRKNKMLHVNRNVGHAVNEDTFYKITDSQLKLIELSEEAYLAYLPYIITETTYYKQNKEEVKTTKKLTMDYNDFLLSFRLKKSKKMVYLFSVGNATANAELNYALVTPPHKEDMYAKVEFNYPKGYPYEEYPNTIKMKNRKDLAELYFTNNETTYTIYQKTQKNKVVSIGLRIKEKNNLHTLEGNVHTLKGNLKDILHSKFDNVEKYK